MRIATKYGLIGGGIILFLVDFALYARLDPQIAAYLGPLMFILFIGFIFMSIKHTKERELDGMLDLIPGLKAGLTTAILYALGFILANILPVIVTPDFYMKTQQALGNKGAVLPTGTQLFGISITFLINYSMIGGLISMLTTLILRTRKVS